MFTVGITGGIGSGKTTISGVFMRLGIPVFFSDIVAAEIIHRDKKVIQHIKREFGPLIFEQNNINRKKLAAIVFKDAEKLSKLNSIIHPAVRTAFSAWIKKHKSAPYVLQESAILIETGIYQTLDYNILIYAPEKIRIRRVMERDKVSRAKVMERIKHQWPDSRKKSAADFILINDEKKMVLPQVLKIHHKLLKK